MAQKLKGEVIAKYDGARYTLVLNYNAVCDFEEATGRNGLAIIMGIEDGQPVDARDMRHLVWAALKQNHPDATVQLAGMLITHAPDAIRALIGASAGEANVGKPEAAAQTIADPVPSPDPVKPKRKTAS